MNIHICTYLHMCVYIDMYILIYIYLYYHYNTTEITWYTVVICIEITTHMITSIHLSIYL